MREEKRVASGEIVHDLADDERAAVLQEIEQIVAKNRIHTDPETFRLQALRRGLGLPLLVNFMAIAVVGLGLWLTTQYFAERGEAARSGADITVTAESRIIEEVRRRSEAELAERDAEIVAVQEQLAAIQAEQQALAEAIEVQVAEREEELRTQVARDVSVERARLQEQGLASSEIDRMISEFESARIAELEAELDDYREQLVRAQETRTAELARLEAASESALEEARRERIGILEEARRTEASLRAEFEEQLGRRRDEAEAAQTRLAALAEQQEQRAFIENQIAGFYDRIRTEVSRARYTEAANLVEQLRSYLDRPNVRDLPFMRDRRESDLYILESLNRLIEPLAADRSAVEDLSDRIGSLQDERDRLRAELREAEEALALAADEQATLAAALESELEAAELRAQAAELEAEEARIVATEAQAEAVAAREQTSASEADAAEAEERARLADERARLAEDRAAAAEAQAVASRAEADQAASRASAAETRLREAEEALAAVQSDVGDIDETLAAAVERAETAEAQRIQAIERAEEAEQELDLIAGRLADAEKAASDAQDRAAAAEARARELAEAAEAGDDLTVLDAETIAELERLRSVEATVRQARNAYERFADAQTGLADGNDFLQVLDGKVRLDQFLRSQAVEAVFPGLATEVARFDEAFEVSGRRAALGDMLEIVYSLSALQARQDRMNFLLEEQSRTDDPVVFEFLEELMDLVVN
ncbi:MAG: hypothetical protein EA383_09490 [Spirochaetaceae bacterium]|nr:MAG: hypothetical protein EA383_09490 [Spirochaetaceae bacterium]